MSFWVVVHIHFGSGHNITKVDFANSKLTFSGLKAVDYFGDGSFYLLNTPGVSTSFANKDTAY
jgi:hypothetical protein